MLKWGACPVCGSSNRSFYCQNCVNQQVFSPETSQPVNQLGAKRDALSKRLNTALRQQETVRQQQVRRWEAQQELQIARAQAQQAKDALLQGKQQLSQLTTSNNSRRVVLEQLNQHTAAARTEALGNTLPTVLRYQTLTLSHVSAMLAREQRTRLRELMEIFALRINAVRNTGGPIQITLCNLRLPENGTSPAGGWPEPQATSAALGYLLVLVDRVAMIMGGPVLHESAHQGSTSSIWQPSSFWNRQPASPASMMPLHVMTAGLGAAAGAGQAAYNSTTSRYLATANFWGLPRTDSGGTPISSIAAGTAAAAAAAYAGAAAAAAVFSRATGLDAVHSSGYSTSVGMPSAAGSGGGGSSNASSSSSGGGAAPAGARGTNRRVADFRAAWDLLQRSLACFLKDKAAGNGMQLPNAWHPLAWLVVYCAVVKRDSKAQDGKLVAASHRADAAAAAAAAAGTAFVGGADDPVIDGCLSGLAAGPSGGAGRSAFADAQGHSWSGQAGIDDGDDDEEDEGWGVVQTPFLPPPPSQPDEVEHWARAMFADGNARLLPQQRGPSTSYGPGVALGSSPGSAGAMMPMERIRSLFSK